MKKNLIIFSLILMPAVLQAQGDPLLHYRRGIEHYNKKQFSNAKKNLETFITEEPYEYEVRSALYHLGEIARRRGHYHKAIEQYNILRKRYSVSKYRRIIDYRLGQCYFHLKIPSRADYHFNRYLKNQKTGGERARTYIYLAQLWESRRDWQQAVNYYKQALLLLEKPEFKNLRTDDVYRSIYRQLGIIYAERLDNKRAAFYYLTRAKKHGLEESTRIRFLFREITQMHLTEKDGLPDPTVSDIEIDGDDVYIGTWGGGLVRFSRSSEEFTRIKLPSPQVRDIHVEPDAVYIATFDGIFVFDKKTSKVRALRTENKLFQLAQKIIKDDRYLYITTLTSGVIRFDLITEAVAVLDQNSFIKTRQVYAAVADHRYIAFGTLDHGVILINKREKKIRRLSSENGHLAKDNVKALYLDGRYLWIGVHNDRLYRHDIETGRTKAYDYRIQYPSVITGRDRKIYVGTSGRGIFIFDREKNTVKRMTAIEGLSSNDVHTIRIEGDYIWVGYLGKGADVLYRPLEDG